MAIEHAERARALLGTRFRPQGRDANGLDCIGVVLTTFGIPADDVPRDYPLSGGRKQELLERLGKTFRKVRKLQPGDIVLMELSSTQLHLAIRTDVGFVHAHAGLRRVVETPGMPEWPVIGIYRWRGKA